MIGNEMTPGQLPSARGMLVTETERTGKWLGLTAKLAPENGMQTTKIAAKVPNTVKILSVTFRFSRMRDIIIQYVCVLRFGPSWH